MAHHDSIEIINGTPAYKVDVGGSWQYFRAAVCVDYGGNEYQRRLAPTSTMGLAAAGPRGVPCKVSYREICTCSTRYEIIDVNAANAAPGPAAGIESSHEELAEAEEEA